MNRTFKPRAHGSTPLTPMSELVSIDPSINSVGAARWSDGVLVAAAQVRGLASVADKAIGVRCLAMAVEIHRWHTPKPPAHFPLELAFEWPQVYRAVKSKGDPNQLIGIAGVGSALAGIFAAQNRLANLVTPTPAEWIGQLPKVCPACRGRRSKACKACGGSAWETPRGRRIRSRLKPSELALVPDQHDAIDAVGIGLYALGRLDVARVFPGAV